MASALSHQRLGVEAEAEAEAAVEAGEDREQMGRKSRVGYSTWPGRGSGGTACAPWCKVTRARWFGFGGGGSEWGGIWLLMI